MKNIRTKEHHYATTIEWTGNKGEGTSSYQGYERSHTIRVENKAEILASSDPSFRGDAEKYNPEELLLASLSSCHMLWYLHLCSEKKIIVTSYYDHAEATMEETTDGSGRFTSVTLKPRITVSNPEHISLAEELHRTANEKCFIANSVNFKVRHEASINAAERS